MKFRIKSISKFLNLNYNIIFKIYEYNNCIFYKKFPIFLKFLKSFNTYFNLKKKK